MSVLDLAADALGLVTAIRFSGPITVLPLASGFRDIDHEDIARVLAAEQAELASVIIFVRPLSEKLHADPRHMRQTHEIVVGEALEEARRRTVNRYPSPEQIAALLRERGCPTEADNYSAGADKKSKDKAFRSELERRAYEAYELAELPEIIDEHREAARSRFDERSGEDVDLDPVEAEAVWAEERVRMFLPRVWTQHERQYLMPEPFCHWDPRNFFQQWFFVARGGQVAYRQGGSGSSGQREDQGRFAHVFATMAEKHGIETPTWVLRYDELNELRLVDRHGTFRAVDRELSGNYPAPASELKALFRGRLIPPDDVQE